MSEHAFLAPSSASQWVHCTALPHVESNAGVSASNPRTEQGNAAHWALSESFVEAKDCAYFLGKQAPNGLFVDQEMVDGAEVMRTDILQTINHRANALDVRRTLLIEHRVKMPQIHEQNWGTLDAACYDELKRVLFVWDYKHGHRKVNAFENWQLIDYVAGLVNHFNLQSEDDTSITVVLRIVNPFAYRSTGPIEEWVCKLSDLRGYFNRLTSAAFEVFTNPKLKTGLHCRDCSKLSTCAAAREACYNVTEVISNELRFDTLSDDALANDLRIMKSIAPVIKSRIETLEDEALARIQAGKSVPGWTSEKSYGRNNWSVSPQEVRTAAQMFGVDVDKKNELITPAQAVSACDVTTRDAFKLVVDNLSKRTSSGLKLVDAKDSRISTAFRKEI